jgi:hypothetical protein
MADEFIDLLKASANEQGTFTNVVDEDGTRWWGSLITYGGGGSWAFGRSDTGEMHMWTCGNFPEGRDPGLTGVRIKFGLESSKEILKALTAWFEGVPE